MRRREKFGGGKLFLFLGVVATLSVVPPFTYAKPEESFGDEVEIQKQIDALGKKGGVVKLEAKTYIIKRSIVLRDNITIQGQGMDKTIIKMAENLPKPPEEREKIFQNTAFVNEKWDERKYPEGNHNITIKDLTLDGNAPLNLWVGEGIALPNTYNYRIEKVRVKNFRGFAGIYTNPNHRSAEKKILSQNYILDSIVEGTQAALNRDATYGHGIYITAWDNDNVLIRGNICRNNKGSGINLEDGVKYIFVKDNEIYDNGQYGIWICGVGYSVFKDNKIYRNTRGIHVVNGYYLFIYNNLIYENGLEGIYLGNWGMPWHSKYYKSKDKPPGSLGSIIPRGQKLDETYNLIVGNVIKNNNQYYVDAGAGVHIETQFNTVAHNYIYDDQEDKTQFLGVITYAPNNVIINNYLRPHAYKTGEFFSMGLENIYLPFDYKRGWTPENLVDKY